MLWELSSSVGVLSLCQMWHINTPCRAISSPGIERSERSYFHSFSTTKYVLNGNSELLTLQSINKRIYAGVHQHKQLRHKITDRVKFGVSYVINDDVYQQIGKPTECVNNVQSDKYFCDSLSWIQTSQLCSVHSLSFAVPQVVDDLTIK